MSEVPPKLMQQQHEMLTLALALLSKGLHPLPTTKAAAADAACCSARKLPPDAKAAAAVAPSTLLSQTNCYWLEKGCTMLL
jgi:hypothetical protein